MLPLDQLLDQRYDDRVRRAYRNRRWVSAALWWWTVLGVLAVAAAYLLADQVAVLATLAVWDGFLGWVAMVGFVSVTFTLTAIFKRRAERAAEYRTFAGLLGGGRPDNMSDRPRTANDADDAITFLHAWNDFEVSAAGALTRTNADFDHLSLPSLLQALRSNDLLDEVDVHRLRVLIRLRNAIARGTPTAVPPVAIALLEQVRSVLSGAVGGPADRGHAL